MKTASLHLVAGPRARPAGGPQGVEFAPSPRLRAFVAGAAEAGLPSQLAVELALRRFYALCDAEMLGFERSVARSILSSQAGPPRKEIAPAEASRLRSLSLGRPIATPNTEGGVSVELSGPLLTRIGEGAPLRALNRSYIPEMVAWEVAAAFEGQSMGEWVLRTLAVSLAA